MSGGEIRKTFEEMTDSEKKRYLRVAIGHNEERISALQSEVARIKEQLDGKRPISKVDVMNDYRREHADYDRDRSPRRYTARDNRNYLINL